MAFGGFSKVTNFLRDTLSAIDGTAFDESYNTAENTEESPTELVTPPRGVEDLEVNTLGETGFEMVTTVRD